MHLGVEESVPRENSSTGVCNMFRKVFGNEWKTVAVILETSIIE